MLFFCVILYIKLWLLKFVAPSPQSFESLTRDFNINVGLGLRKLGINFEENGKKYFYFYYKTKLQRII